MSEGEFLWTMAEHAVIEDDRITAIVLDIVRERILQIAFEGWCELSFEVDGQLEEVPAMMSVHPFRVDFGVETKRLAPAALIGLSSELEAEVLDAGPASDWIGNSLDRFINNMDLSNFLADRPTVGDFATASSLRSYYGNTHDIGTQRHSGNNDQICLLERQQFAYFCFDGIKLR